MKQRRSAGPQLRLLVVQFIDASCPRGKTGKDGEANREKRKIETKKKSTNIL